MSGLLAATDAAPSQAYASGVAAGRWDSDPAQQVVLAELDRIHRALSSRRNARFWQRLRARWKRPTTVPGLYLWGGVGHGKTFLVDLLYDTVPGRRKQRVHFHRFMAQVHAQLRDLPGHSDPLETVAANLASQTRLLVLDEFVVTDIGDAMILARLLQGLFRHGVSLVTTSNTAPANLYRDGLQRARFLPAIALIERHCHVHALASSQDYRLRQLTQAPVYLSPLDDASAAAIAHCFVMLSANAAQEPGPLVLLDRELPVRGLAEGVVWFDFAALCEGPRAVDDYIELARSFHTVLISDVPQLDFNREDAARRFIHLIDEFYDRNVNLIISAASNPQTLYRGERLSAAFERTSSRLIEMQSADYLEREHRG